MEDSLEIRPFEDLEEELKNFDEDWKEKFFKEINKEVCIKKAVPAFTWDGDPDFLWDGSEGIGTYYPDIPPSGRIIINIPGIEGMQTGECSGCGTLIESNRKAIYCPHCGTRVGCS